MFQIPYQNDQFKAILEITHYFTPMLWKWKHIVWWNLNIIRLIIKLAILCLAQWNLSRTPISILFLMCCILILQHKSLNWIIMFKFIDWPNPKLNTSIAIIAVICLCNIFRDMVVILVKMSHGKELDLKSFLNENSKNMLSIITFHQEVWWFYLGW